MMKALLFCGILHLATASLFPEIDTLQKVLVVYRHGDRAPVGESYPTDPNRNYKWTDGAGNLTTLGRQQAITLGTVLRRRYDGFLREDDVPVTEAFARTSSVLRCILTTICVLTGIYEPEKPETCYQDTGYTPSPVYTVKPGDTDHMLYASPYCPRFDVELKKLLTSPAFANYLKQNQIAIEQLQNVSGIPNLKNPVTLLGFYDTIAVERAHGLPIPPGLDALLPDLQKLGTAIYNFLSFTDELSKLQAGFLLNDILIQLQQPVLSQRLYLYGTHDTIVLPTLKLLRVSNDLPPPYTAAVMIELHEKQSLLRTNLCVQIFYRNSTTQGTPYKMNIRGCPEDCCPLGKYIQLTQVNAMPDPENGCSVPSGSTS